MGKKENHGEYGAVLIIEAVFVFPIMFIIIFIMLLAGGAYFQHARVERLVVEAAIDGASRCENPMLEKVSKAGSVPTSTSDAKIMPYRYLFTGNAKSISDEVASELRNTVERLNSLAFKGMEPKNVSVKVTPKMFILISSFQVECEFDIVLPVRMLFSDEDLKFHYSVSMTEPVGDPSEFVRNISTIQDILEGNEKAASIAEKFKEETKKIARFIN